jgi:hypothetical protein
MTNDTPLMLIGVPEGQGENGVPETRVTTFDATFTVPVAFSSKESCAGVFAGAAAGITSWIYMLVIVSWAT